MWAFAVYNQWHNWVELWHEMPTLDVASEGYIGTGYLCSWIFPEVPLEVIESVRKHGPLLVSVNMSFGFWASASDVKTLMSAVPRCFNGQKVNNV